jgi:hypothetical protein
MMNCHVPDDLVANRGHGLREYSILANGASYA